LGPQSVIPAPPAAQLGGSGASASSNVPEALAEEPVVLDVTEPLPLVVVAVVVVEDVEPADVVTPCSFG